MVVGVLSVQLRLSGCRSLKEKRQALRGAIERIRRSFHVSIAEVGDQELWGNASVGVAAVSNNATHAEAVLTKVLTVFDSVPDWEVEAVSREVIRFES